MAICWAYCQATRPDVPDFVWKPPSQSVNITSVQTQTWLKETLDFPLNEERAKGRNRQRVALCQEWIMEVSVFIQLTTTTVKLHAGHRQSQPLWSVGSVQLIIPKFTWFPGAPPNFSKFLSQENWARNLTRTSSPWKSPNTSCFHLKYLSETACLVCSGSSGNHTYKSMEKKCYPDISEPQQSSFQLLLERLSQPPGELFFSSTCSLHPYFRHVFQCLGLDVQVSSPLCLVPLLLFV